MEPFLLTFPQLKSGAVLQYPAPASVRFDNNVLSFLDGSEQRYRLAPGPLRRWTVQLALLEDAELNALETFIADTQGAFGTFAFTDPKDGKVYSSCYLKSDSLEGLRSSDLRGSTMLQILESPAS